MLKTRVKTNRSHESENQDLSLVAFSTRIGWVGLLHRDYVLQLVKMGLPSQASVFDHFREFYVGPKKPDAVEKEWIKLIKDYGNGKRVSFRPFAIDETDLTPFQKSVIHCCRKIPFGKTRSYGELAAEAGHPKAARAVGSVMRKNRFPLVVPCHRVVASNGIGGFSAPNGTSLKYRLLDLEGAAGQFDSQMK